MDERERVPFYDRHTSAPWSRTHLSTRSRTARSFRDIRRGRDARQEGGGDEYQSDTQGQARQNRRVATNADTVGRVQDFERADDEGCEAEHPRAKTLLRRKAVHGADPIQPHPRHVSQLDHGAS